MDDGKHSTSSFVSHSHSQYKTLNTMSDIPPTQSSIAPTSSHPLVYYNDAGNPFCRDANGQWLPYYGYLPPVCLLLMLMMNLFNFGDE